MDINDLVVPMILDPLQEERVTVTGRVLNIPESLQTVGVKTDNKVERIYFELPRYFDGFNDFSEFNFYINYVNANGDGDVYYCDDLEIEDDNVVFSWLTKEKLYASKGTAQFTVRAMHSDGRKWNTTIAQLTILDGLETQEAVVEQDYDFINQQFEIIKEHTEKLNALIEQVKANTTNLDNAINTMGQAEWNGNQVRFTDGKGNYGQYHDVSGEFISRDEIYLGYSMSQDYPYSGHASDYGIRVAQIEGAYEQDTTNGFQLFDASKFPTTSQGGATVTNNGDGSFTVSGNGSLSSTFSFSHNYTHEETIKLLQVNKTIYAKERSEVVPTIVFRLQKGNGVQETISPLGYTITEEDVENPNFYIQLLMYGSSGAEIKTGTYKPMIYQDGDGEYEPFTGGKPSPSPEYPQEPKFTKIRKFVSSGKNLFDINKITNVSGIVNNDDGTITVTTNETTSAMNTNKTLKELANLKVGETYTLSAKTSGSNKYACLSGLSNSTWNFGEHKTVTQDDLDSYVLLYASGVSTTANISNIQIELGDKATSYTPYRWLIETPTYHNLFNISGELNQTKDGNQSGANLNTLEGNVLVAGANSSMVDCQGQKLVNDLTGKKISVGVNITSLGTGTKGKVMIYDGGELGYGFEKGLGKYSIDGYPCKTDNVVVAFGTVDGDKARFEDIIVNIGEEAEEWIPYVYTDKPQGVLELRALPDGTKDTYNMTYEDMGLDNIPIAKVTFDGSDDENWSFIEKTNGFNAFSIVIPNALKSTSNLEGITICNRFVETATSNFVNPTENGYVYYGVSESAGNIFFIFNGATDLSSWKTYLQSNPISVWYKLATPTTEPIEIPILTSYYPFTNAWCDSELEPKLIEWHVNNKINYIEKLVKSIQQEVIDNV